MQQLRLAPNFQAHVKAVNAPLLWTTIKEAFSLHISKGDFLRLCSAECGGKLTTDLWLHTSFLDRFNHGILPTEKEVVQIHCHHVAILKSLRKGREATNEGFPLRGRDKLRHNTVFRYSVSPLD